MPNRRSFSVTVEDVVFVPSDRDLGDVLDRRVVGVLEQADTLEAAVLGSDERPTRFAADLQQETSRG